MILKLKKHCDKRLNQGHLWVYSNEVDTNNTPLKKFAPGSLIAVENSQGKYLGTGYINPNNLLCARILTKNHHETIDKIFFQNRIKNALLLREKCFTKPFYRLIYSESDRIPGLIVDRFNNILVVQFTTQGIENLKDIIIAALIDVIKPKAILAKNDGTFRDFENLPKYVAPLFGEIPKIITLEENNTIYSAPIWEGQKTGWFYDQKKNRASLAKYVKNKRVLDIFSYIGAWGILAAKNGANEVTCIDTSEKAIEFVKINAKNNNVESKIATIANDAFSALKDLLKNKELFDTIILDPPAFIKKQKDLKEGFNAYIRIHELAFKLLEQNGTLFTTSCSQHLTKDMLQDVLQKAAYSTKREISIIEHLHQAEDHPIHPSIPETNYLKGFVLST